MICRRVPLAAAFAALILTWPGIPAAAGVIGSWDYDAQATTPTQGDGSQVLIGWVVATTTTWVTGQTSSSYPSWGYETDSYPAQSAGNRTAGIQFSISTGGYTGITVSFDKQHSATASRFVRFQFSTNGGSSWSDAATGSLMQETTTNWTNWSFDLSSFPAADDNTNFMFQMVTEFDPQSSPGSYTATGNTSTYSPLGTIAWDNVVVTGTRNLLANFIEDVPDVNQPCANPLNVQSFVNVDFCAPTSAVNITEYWDVVAGSAFATYVDGNPNPGPTSVLQFMGWWMNTNDDPAWTNRCPYRANGNPPPGSSGTKNDDIAPGLAQYVRWDASNDFGCTPPTLLVGKTGYDWTVALTRPAVPGWTTIKSEINATPERPLIVCWEYWNPINAFYDSTDDITYYDWGAPTSGSTNPKETWNPSADIGHAVTAVGYKQNYDPRGGFNPQDWVIVHDNWYTTARDVAIPWLYWDAPTHSFLTHCTALVTADPATAPSVGALSGTTGAKNPGNHNAPQGSADVVAQISLTASSTENILVNAITLAASGGGDDSTEIKAIELVEDMDISGTVTPGDTSLVKYNSGFPTNNGTLTIIIPGNWKYTINASKTSDLLVVYHISPTALNGSTFSFTVNKIYATGLTSFLQCTVDNGTPPNPFTFTSCTVTAYTQPAVVDPGLGEWKGWPDGWRGGRFGMMKPYPVITFVGDDFYVAEPDNSAGLKLKFVGFPPPEFALPGDQIGFEGMIYTENDERVVLITDPPYTMQPAAQRPLGMPIKSIGGGDWNWNSINHTGQKGVVGGVGLNNVGLLVRTAGKFFYVNDTMFMLDDGSGAVITCVVPPGQVFLEPWWETVMVTGVCSTEKIGEELHRVLRVRMQDDITRVLPLTGM